MASTLEQLRRDDTSRFWGVPRDLTQLLAEYCRPLEGEPRPIKRKSGCQPLGLTLEDQLIVQLSHPDTGQLETQVLSIPDLVLVSKLDLPSCQTVWPLANGDFFCQIDEYRFGYQQQEYCLEFTNAGVSLVQVTGLVMADHLDLFNRMMVVWSSHLDVTPEGKFYFSHHGTAYEYDLHQKDPARPLFEIKHDAFMRQPGIVTLRQNNIRVRLNQLYCCLADTLLIYDLTTGTVTNHPGFRTIDPGYYNFMLVDPATQHLYFHWQGKVKRADEAATSRYVYSIPRYISRSGYLISTDSCDRFCLIISS